jgi:Flp pilus assembly protein TadG
MSATTRWFDWLTSRERRRVKRQETLPLVAHFWDGGAPMAHKVRDISSHGLYLLTQQRWYPGTLVTLSLQREDLSASDPNRSVSVQARVIRADEDGVGFTFVMRTHHGKGLQSETARVAFESFLRRLKSTRGQALIEYILLLPLIFLLILNLVNFAGFFFAWIAVANAARAGADYAVLGGASAGFIAKASGSQIYTMISEDIKALPNSSSIVVQVCQNNNGTVSTVYGATCPTTPPTGTTDPEATSYVLTWVDVTYTYTPFIGAGFQFPNLKVYATIPPTTITRRAIMRSIN